MVQTLFLFKPGTLGLHVSPMMLVMKQNVEDNKTASKFDFGTGRTRMIRVMALGLIAFFFPWSAMFYTVVCRDFIFQYLC